jgi:PBP1b-binding outer membrane lipoprotein LpoB
MIKKGLNIAIFACVILLTSCIGNHRSRHQVEQAADSFAENYFNYQFEEAAKHATKDSERWLRYAASNIHKADVEMLRSQDEGASVDVENVTLGDGDSTAIATIKVHNYMRLDTIGNAGRMINEDRFLLNMMKEEGKWKIKMEGLPQSEKQNHD